MKLDELLNSGLINLAEVGRRIWGDKPGNATRMSLKFNNKNGQRLTDKDKQAIAELFKQYL